VFEKSDAVLERGRFGKTDIPLLWVEGDSIPEIARLLRADPDLQLDWLENLSVMQVDGILVASWFLRSRKTKAKFVLRSTVMPGRDDQVVDLASTADVWPESELLERESSELFGIRFGGRELPQRLLPKDFAGFPLRKEFDMRAVLARDSGLGVTPVTAEFSFEP
jgi:Ni,Fe-hydrogenase III component G